jgi:hypothetical protein
MVLPRTEPPSAETTLSRHGAFALLVDGGNRLDQAQRHAIIVGSLDQGAGVFGETRAAKSGAGVQKFAPDPIVETHTARDFLHVGADLLAQIRYLVDESDLGREERIGCVLDQFGGAPADIDDRGRGQHFARAIVIAIRMLEILGAARVQRN